MSAQSFFVADPASFHPGEPIEVVLAAEHRSEVERLKEEVQTQNTYKHTAIARAEKAEDDLARARHAYDRDVQYWGERARNADAELGRMCNRVHHGEHTENCPFCAKKPNGPGVPDPMCHLCALESERDTLRAECDRLKRELDYAHEDGKRLDWLAEQDFPENVFATEHGMPSCWTPETIRAAIDKAREEATP